MSIEGKSTFLPSDDEQFYNREFQTKPLTSLDFWRNPRFKKDMQIRHAYLDCQRDFNWFESFAASDVNPADLERLISHTPELVRYIEESAKARAVSARELPAHVMLYHARYARSQESTGPGQNVPLTPRDICREFIGGMHRKEIPLEVFGSFYAQWMEYLNEQETQLTKEFAEDAARFIKRAASIRRPFAFSATTIATMQSRLARLRFSLHDPMLMRRTKGKEAGLLGYYSEPNNFRITLPVSASREERRHIVVHELTHALMSGRVVKYSPAKGLEDTKRGLHFGSSKWLDEGVTEWITCTLLNESPVTYEVWVERVEDLVRGGVSPQQIVDAYAENYDPRTGGLRQSKEFFQKLFEVKGKKWFNEMNEMGK